MRKIYYLALFLLLANVTSKASVLIDDINQAVKSDIKIKITKGKASSSQKNMGIENAFDGDLKTVYHSNNKNTESNYFPIDLTFNFGNEDIDYLIYHPRSSGANGIFKEVEIYATTKENPSLTKFATKTFRGSNTATKVEFDAPLRGVTSITIKVLSGMGSRQGFASCAEMEFFQYNPDNFKALTLFSDKSCSKLKKGITIKEIKECKNTFYQKIALAMYKNKYPSEYRIDSYKAWMEPKIQSKQLKTAAYSLLDNPTGIVAIKGSPLIVFVGETHGHNLSIKIQDLLNVGYGGDNFYPLVEGANKIVPRDSGLVYVMYHSEKPEEKKPINIHFATGEVNGYFDSQKHKPEDWSKILNATTYAYFDVLGEYAHLTFPTQHFKEFTPDGKALIDFYDRLVTIVR